MNTESTPTQQYQLIIVPLFSLSFKFKLCAHNKLLRMKPKFSKLLNL